MTITEQIRDKTLPRSTSAQVYSFDFDFDSPEWVLVQWGSSKDRQLWSELTLGSDYTVEKTFGGGIVTLIISPDTLVDAQGMPFAWLNVQSIYPYEQIYSLPNNYSLGSFDLILTYIEIQIQQIWSLVTEIANIEGLWINFRLVAPPNERGRIPKINNDDGTMFFMGSALIDDGSKVTSEKDFYVDADTFLRGNTDVSGNLSVLGSTSLTGNLTGSNASLTGSLSVTGTGAFNLVVSNEGLITNLTSTTAAIETINSTTINNAGLITNLGGISNTGTLDNTGNIVNSGALTTNTAKVDSTLVVEGVSTFKDTINALNTRLILTGGGTDNPIVNPDDTGYIRAPRLTADIIVDVNKFIGLRNVLMYPRFENAQAGDVVILSTPTGGAGSNFDLTRRTFLGAGGFLDVSLDRIAKGALVTNVLTDSALVNSDLFETTTDVVVETKNLTVTAGNLTVTAGNLTVAAGNLTVEGPESTIESTSGLMAFSGQKVLFRTDTFRRGLHLGINELIIEGQLVYEIIGVVPGNGGGVLVTKDVYAIGDGIGSLVDGDLSQDDTVISVNTRSLALKVGDFIIENGVFTLTSGEMNIENQYLTWDFSNFDDGKVLGLRKYFTGQRTDYEIIALDASAGGGGFTGSVTEGFYALGGGGGTLKIGDLTENDEDIVVKTKSLVVDTGDILVTEGDLISRGNNSTLVLKSAHLKLAGQHIFFKFDDIADGKLLSYKETINQNGRVDYEIVPVSAGGLNAINIKENVFAMGGPTDTGTIADAPVGLVNTDIVSQTGWSFKSERLKCDALVLNNFLSITATSQSLDPFNAKLRINLDWMSDGDTKELVLKRIDSENCEIFPLAISPPIPITPGPTWVDNSVAFYSGWDEYNVREIYGHPKALVYDDTLENFNFKLAGVKTLSRLVDSRSPSIDGQGEYSLVFNPNSRSTLLVTFNDNIQRLSFTEPMENESTLIIYFVCDTSGKTITFPSDLLWPNGFNKVYTIAGKINAVELQKINGQIKAIFLRGGTSFDTESIRPLPPFIPFGTATFESIFGTQMLASEALTQDETLTNWKFPLAEVKQYSSPVRTLTAVGGVLTIPFDTEYSAFTYIHDTDLTVIRMTVNSDLKAGAFCWNLRIITGTSTQRVLPKPEGCWISEEEIIIKEGNAFLSGIWSRSQMTLMPILAYDFIDI